MPQATRRAIFSASAFGEAGSQLWGRNNRQLTAAEAWSQARWSETPTWQLVTLPAVPVYCRDTHAEALPSLRNPVSSKTTASGPIVSSIRQAS
jgi:hypothetical protein